MKSKVADFIGKHGLLTKDALHLVALSGGADSVALLLVLHELGYRIEAVHCNFHLRGEESDRDETFVKNLCTERGIPIHLIHFDTKEYASAHQVSIEMAARELRYRYFEQLRTDLEAETVCVAHHRDDAVETLLMNLMRGAGIHGLTGIRPRNGSVVRPLLCVSRGEIEDYLRSKGQSYVTDSTNLEPDVLRNKIRLQLLPLMETIQSGTADNLARSAYYLSEAEKIYDAEIARETAQYKTPSSLDPHHSSLITYHSSLITSSPSPLCLLHELLTPLGFNRTQIEQILTGMDSESGRVFSSPTHTLVIDRECLIVEPLREPMRPLVIPEPGRYRLDENVCFDVLQTDDVTVSKSPDVATLDAYGIQFPLTVRPVQQGDRFQPYGMQGQKLVSDFLTDLKLNLFEKRRQLVLADATGTILWLVGLRIDHRYRVTPDTAAVLRLSLLVMGTGTWGEVRTH
ncbi:MAG: tRNA lysidine(34) synthetase TilS [Prevotella sp.]|nr:tRNA lysidine(34) synthetase TilS [Prevotella sp.]